MVGLQLHGKREHTDERPGFPGFYVVVELVLVGVLAVLLYGLVRMI